MTKPFQIDELGIPHPARVDIFFPGKPLLAVRIPFQERVPPKQKKHFFAVCPIENMGVSENVVYPIVPTGFADPYPYEKWLAIIGNINPTFSGSNPHGSIINYL